MVKDYITVTQGMCGFFAVHVWLNEEEEDFGPFWEHYETGFGRYATSEEAVAEAKDWAEASGMELKV